MLHKEPSACRTHRSAKCRCTDSELRIGLGGWKGVRGGGWCKYFGAGYAQRALVFGDIGLSSGVPRGWGQGGGGGGRYSGAGVKG